MIVFVIASDDDLSATTLYNVELCAEITVASLATLFALVGVVRRPSRTPLTWASLSVALILVGHRYYFPH